MTPVVKLGAFGVVLGLALGGGALAGRVVGPIDDGPRPGAVADAGTHGDGGDGSVEHDAGEGGSRGHGGVVQGESP